MLNLEKVFSLWLFNPPLNPMKSTMTASSLRVSRAITTLGLLALPALAHAELLSSWTQYTGSITSDLNTASPVIGNGTTESADDQTIYAASASPYTLATVGDTITLSGGVTFTNLNAPQADQFRFGLYDVNGQSGATGWLGYFATNSGTSTGQTYSRLWERDNPNSGSFGSGAGATLVGTANATPGNLSFATGSYTFSLTATRTASGLDLAWTILGTNVTYSVSGTYSDATPQTYTFDRVGIFTGGGLNADQVSFSNVDLTYTSAIPEPASAAVVLASVAGLLTFASRRRRAPAAA